MLKKRLAIFVILGGLLFLLTGCWNQSELDEKAIVAGVGFDLIEGEENIMIIAQILVPGAITAGSGAGSGGEQEVVELVAASGDTTFSAVRNVILETGRKGLYSHNKIVVIGEALAKKGVDKILDYLEREPDFRRRQWILVARGNAQEIMEGKVKLEKIPAYGVSRLMKSNDATSKIVAVNLHEFSGTISSKTTCAVAPGIEAITEEKKDQINLRLKGTAIFKNYKLVGWLDDMESRGLLWVQGNVVSGAINIPVPEEPEQLVAIEIIRANSKIQPEIKDGKITINIEINEEGNIANQQFFDLSKATPEAVMKMEVELQKTIKSQILNTLNKAKELNTDIFGFGEAIYRKYPHEWKKIEKNWDEIFPNLNVKIEVNAFIRMLGLIKNLKNPK